MFWGELKKKKEGKGKERPSESNIIAIKNITSFIFPLSLVSKGI